MNSSNTVLLTGGRAPVTLDLARHLHRFGCRVIVAETSRFHLCRFSRAVAKNVVVPAPVSDARGFVDALLRVVREEEVKFILPTCEEIFALSAHHDRIVQECSLWCEPLAKLEPLHNKAKFMAFLQERGFTYPETTLLSSASQLLPALSLWPRVVFKPVYSRFARHVVIANSEDREALGFIRPSPEQPWVAQRFIEGRRLATYSVAVKGEVVAHVAYPMEFCLGEHGSTMAFAAIDHPALSELIRQIVKALDFTGQIAFDLVETPAGTLYPIECNPRATSGVHLFPFDGGLAKAILEGKPGAIAPIGTQAALKVPLALLGINRDNLWKALPLLKRAREVVFDRKDPWPGLTSPFLLLHYLWRAKQMGMSMTEASTYDIEWNGDLCALR